MGALDNSSRGIWSITSRGRELLAQGRDAVVTANRTAHSEARRRRKSLTLAAEMADRESDELVEQASESWRAELLIVLTSMSPDSFERLCARLVRSLGCRDVEVSRYSDDEGLDGTGVLQVSLLSFPVFSKRSAIRLTAPSSPTRSASFAVRWPIAVTRAFSSPPASSPPVLETRLVEGVPPLISSTGRSSATCCMSTASEWSLALS